MSDEPAGKRNVSEDIEMSETYITQAEDVIFEGNRYLETHPAPLPPAAPPAVATSSDSKWRKISLHSMKHEVCRLWF